MNKQLKTWAKHTL